MRVEVFEVISHIGWSLSDDHVSVVNACFSNNKHCAHLPTIFHPGKCAIEDLFVLANLQFTLSFWKYTSVEPDFEIYTISHVVHNAQSDVMNIKLHIVKCGIYSWPSSFSYKWWEMALAACTLTTCAKLMATYCEQQPSPYCLSYIVSLSHELPCRMSWYAG